MQAVILAAGMGKRLKELTQSNTKCMVRVNGITLIERMLHQLESQHLSRIVIVVGFEGDKLIKFIDTLGMQTPIIYVNNPIFDKTNNIYSLSLAKEYLRKEDTLLLESDLIFETSVIEFLLNDPRDSLALVDKYESWMDGTCVKLGSDDNIETFVPGKNFKFNEIRDYYKTVNIYKFSRHFSETYYVPFLEAYTIALGNNVYYEEVLRVIIMLGNTGIMAKRLEGQKWYEIDDIQDLNIAESMFTENEEERVDKLLKRHGGYWRYPKLLDFSQAVNPYFPPQRLMDEIKSNFEILLTRYPSDININSLLAAKDFGVKKEYIVVGNGTLELIKEIIRWQNGKIGFVCSVFEEYSICYDRQKSVIFDADKFDFEYGADDIIAFYSDQNVDVIVMFNPDNFSGSFLSKDDLIALCGWTQKKNIKLIIDESLVDFTDGESNSLLDNQILERYTNLVVLKDLSQSYGVSGLRLGILASSNIELIDSVKCEVGIWNINSFAEFYLQIMEKYLKDYDEAIEKFKRTRKKFLEEIKKIPAVRIYSSQVNFVMCEILNGMTSAQATKKLLQKNILIKDLTPKIANGRQYVRLAIKTQQDNEKILGILMKILP